MQSMGGFLFLTGIYNMDIQTLITFGILDNLLLIVGMAYSYLSIEYYLDKIEIDVSPMVIGMLSAGCGNTFSDTAAMVLQGHFLAGIWVGVGCLIGMLIIPLFRNKKSDEGVTE